MKRPCVLALTWFLLTFFHSSALAEGFALQEWSARGLGLAGGMVGRADDPSALAYNAAGITQLPGTQIMGGLALVAPYGSIKGRYEDGHTHTSAINNNVWTPFHAYITHQYNDNVWFGLGMFSRFGLGNGYSGDWFGRYNIYDVGFQTFSVVPTMAYKVNDMLSVSLGLEVMYAHLYQGAKIPTARLGMAGGNAAVIAGPDKDLQVEAQGVGVGIHAGLHLRFNEQWALGLAYKSQVTQSMAGDADFSPQGSNLLADLGRAPRACNADLSGVVQLPDSLALGVMYKPLENLSFEAGVIFTRWSTYNSLNINFDAPSGYRAISEKNFRDGWNFNVSMEYQPLDWLTLRLGFWHETPVCDHAHADFMMPVNGRDVFTTGLGFRWNNWTLDLAYAHIWIYPTSYYGTDGGGIRANGITGARSGNANSDVYAMSVGYTF